LVADWYREHRVGTRKSLLIAASTNEEVNNLNELARDKLIQGKFVRRGHVIPTAHGSFRFAAGDRIIFTGNRKRIGIYNSELATIKSINPLTLAVTAKTDSGNTVTFDPFKMNEFRHGYAITTHKSQGATVDKVYTLYDGYFMDREKGYVAMSRGREGNMIYSDRATLGKLTFEEQKALKEVPEDKRKQAENKLYRMKLSDLLSRSNRKDTTLDYHSPNQPVEHSANRNFSDIYKRSPLQTLLDTFRFSRNISRDSAPMHSNDFKEKNQRRDNHER